MSIMSIHFLLVSVCVLSLLTTARSFTIGLTQSRFSSIASSNIRHKTSLFSARPSFNENSMTVDELKSELEMRGVEFDDCISKNELVDRLIQSRVDGKAKVDILEKFNMLDESEVDLNAFDDKEIISQATSRDGNLVGGMYSCIIRSLISVVCCLLLHIHVF